MWIYDEDEYDKYMSEYKQPGFVYCITNIIDDIKYIGAKMLKDSKGKETQWKKYQSSSKYVKDDIKRLGVDNFKFEILSFHESKHMTFYRETELHMELGVLYKKKDDGITKAYYNYCVGGNKFYSKNHTDESKRKMREAKIGKKLSDEHKKKMSESKIGKPKSDEHKRKMSESRKGEKHHMARKIGRFNIEGELLETYNGGQKLFIEQGFNQSHIYQCCKGKLKTHKGFIWKYLESTL